MNNFFFNRAERLFLIDDFIMGVLRITDMSIQFYKADLSNKRLITLNKKQFYDEEPFDACVDNANNIFVVFPAQNKITKFNLRADTPSFQNLTSIDLKEETSINGIDISVETIEDLIKLHKGEILYKNQIQKGSITTIIIPHIKKVDKITFSNNNYKSDNVIPFPIQNKDQWTNSDAAR